MSSRSGDKLLTGPSAEAADHALRVRHRAMACTWEVYIVGEDAKYARQAALAALAEVDRVEQEISRFVEHSDVARINALPAGASLRVGIETLECLELAAQVHADTGGAFDVTVGALLKRAPDAPLPPCGMQLLTINRQERTVTVLADGLIVDLGGIGKGYALDRAVTALREWSIETALAHCGQSTVCATGNPPGQDGWEVALRDPADQDASLGSVMLHDAALSGSGARLHGQHIIDPRSGQPSSGALGAWALAPSAALADALSTAFMVLSPAEVVAYCQSHAGVSGLMQVRSAEGAAPRAAELVTAGGFPRKPS